MKKLSNPFISFISATLVFLYIFGIAFLISNGEKFFGEEETFLIPVFMLLLFIISACITGGLVLGRPILLFLNGQKKESLTLFFYTLGWLFFFLLLILAANIWITK